MSNILKYSSINNGTEYEIIGYDEIDSNLVIPSHYNNIPVTSIGSRAFERVSKINTVTLPETIKTIKDNAFNYCLYMKSINLPDSLTSIDQYAFYYCKALEQIKIPKNLTEIAKSTFADSALASVEFSGCENLKSIEMNAFYRCSSLRKINLPVGLESIGDMAFKYCSFKNLSLPHGLLKISNDVFSGNTALREVIIPSTVTNIGSQIFTGCIQIQNIYLLGTAYQCNITIDTFSYTTSDYIKLICYSDNLNGYKNKENWNNYSQYYDTDDLKLAMAESALYQKSYFVAKKEFNDLIPENVNKTKMYEHRISISSITSPVVNTNISVISTNKNKLIANHDNGEFLNWDGVQYIKNTETIDLCFKHGKIEKSIPISLNKEGKLIYFNLTTNTIGTLDLLNSAIYGIDNIMLIEL